jgi:serine/threonine-protein kinase
MSSSQPTEDVPELVKVGEILLDKYRVEQVLGAGGMGLVVAATHLQLDEKVAIKLMLPEAAQSSDAGQRFVKEARAAAKIKSEHVVRVTDVGTLPNGSHYMVMEHLLGRDLAEVLSAGGPLPAPVAVEYILQACEALAEAHAVSIVHRDLKPPNLFLTHRADGSPCIKVLDFGISKFVTGASDIRTKTSAVMGSPLYMSPEQLRSARDVDARSDIWALGAVLFELLTGSPPFDAETIPQLCMQIVEAPTPPLNRSTLGGSVNTPPPSPAAPPDPRPDAPAGLEAVIRRCLEKERDLRFAHVGELARALAPFATARGRLSAERVIEVAKNTRLGSSPGLPVAAVTGLSSEGPAPGEATRLREGMAETRPSGNASVTHGGISAPWGDEAPPRRRPMAAFVAVAVVALLGGAGLAVLLAGGGDGTAAGESSGVAPAAANPQPLETVAPATSPEPGAASQPTASVTPVATAEPADTAAPEAATAAPGTAAPTRVRPGGPARPGGPRPGPGTPGGDELFDERK